MHVPVELAKVGCAERQGNDSCAVRACLTALVLACMCVLGHCAPVQVVPLRASQVHSLPPLPAAQVYDPPLAPGTATQDALWLSYMQREGELVPMELANVSSSGGLRLLSGNASVQLGGWLRLDLHVSLNTTSAVSRLVVPGGMVIGRHAVPGVTVFGCRRFITGCARGSHASQPNASDASCGAVVHNDSDALGSLSALPSWAPPVGSGERLVTLHVELPTRVDGKPPVLGARFGARLQLPDAVVQSLSPEAQSVAQLAAGDPSTYAIMRDGSLWKLGNQDLGSERVNAAEWGSGPGQVRVTLIAAFSDSMCAALEDGAMWCRLGSRPGRLREVISGEHADSNNKGSITALSLGDSGAYAVANGSLWYLPYMYESRYCIGTREQRTLSLGMGALRQVNPSEWGNGAGQIPVMSVNTGWRRTCAVLRDGSLWCWAWAPGNVSPQRVMRDAWGSGPNQQPVTAVAVGNEHLCAILADSSLWCAAVSVELSNLRCSQQQRVVLQAGGSPLHAHVRRVKAEEWGSDSGQLRVVSVATEAAAACAVLSDGSLWCWGAYNERSQWYWYGWQTHTADNSPRRLMPDEWGSGPNQSRVISVAFSEESLCVAVQDGRWWCWAQGPDNSHSFLHAFDLHERCWEEQPSAQPAPWLGVMAGPARDATICAMQVTPVSRQPWVQDQSRWHRWDWMRPPYALQSLAGHAWPLDPRVAPLALNAVGGASRFIDSIVALRQCTVNNGSTYAWEAVPAVTAYSDAHGYEGQQAQLQASAGGQCSGWQLGGVLQGTQSLAAVGPHGEHTLSMSSAQILTLLSPARLHLRSLRPVNAAVLSPSGGAVELRVNYDIPPSSTVQVTLHTPATLSGAGSDCPLLWVDGRHVACTAPPGYGIVYVHVSVDGQAAEEVLPLRYDVMRSGLYVSTINV